MNDRRDTTIDTLRALAITGVIITHVLARNLGTVIVNTLWNYLHFMVPVLIFCSGYITYTRYHDAVWDTTRTLRWLRKRAVRLILPYYIFFLFQYTVRIVLPGILTVSVISINPEFFLKSIFLIGVDYGWLPLLFLQLSVISPIILSAYKSHTGRAILLSLSVSAAILLSFVHIPSVDYRIYMWLPWSFILLLSFSAAERYSRGTLSTRVLVSVSGMAYAIFLLFAWYYDAAGTPATLTLHKYPPDMLYLSYGMGAGSLLLLVSRTGIFGSVSIRRITQWLSSRSYPLFFIHYLVIDMLLTFQHTSHTTILLPLQIIVVASGTVCALWLYETSIRIVSRYYSGK